MSTRRNQHRTSTVSVAHRNQSRSDGLFLVLAIGIVLLASLLIPRSARTTLSQDFDLGMRSTEIASTAVVIADIDRH